MNNRTIDTKSKNTSVKRKEVEKILADFLDYFCEDRLMGIGLKNSPSLRRVLFFKHFIGNNGNATRAAILAGYSPKSAKQQGYRTLRWLQEQIQKENTV